MIAHEEYSFLLALLLHLICFILLFPFYYVIDLSLLTCLRVHAIL